jgi:hypothetical protein
MAAQYIHNPAAWKQNCALCHKSVKHFVSLGNERLQLVEISDAGEPSRQVWCSELCCAKGVGLNAFGVIYQRKSKAEDKFMDSRPQAQAICSH